MARQRATSNSVADTASLEDILSLKYLSCEAPICGHFAGRGAASVCATSRALRVYAESSLAGRRHRACSEAPAFVIECRAEKEFTELRSCS
jgi:hypothetical protein